MLEKEEEEEDEEGNSGFGTFQKQVKSNCFIKYITKESIKDNILNIINNIKSIYRLKEYE